MSSALFNFPRNPCRTSSHCKVGTASIPTSTSPSIVNSHNRMSREKLNDIADRFTAWIVSHDMDPSAVSAIVSPDVVLHIPFPGLSPDFTGLLTQHERTITATKDIQIDVKAVSIDETKCLVTQFFEATGTHTGYYTPLDVVN
jgi:hypothetical protein